MIRRWVIFNLLAWLCLAGFIATVALWATGYAVPGNFQSSGG